MQLGQRLIRLSARFEPSHVITHFRTHLIIHLPTLYHFPESLGQHGNCMAGKEM